MLASGIAPLPEQASVCACLHVFSCTACLSVNYTVYGLWTELTGVKTCFMFVSLLCTQQCFSIVFSTCFYYHNHYYLCCYKLAASVSVITVDMTIFETATDSMGKIIIQKTCAIQTFCRYHYCHL